MKQKTILVIIITLSAISSMGIIYGVFNPFDTNDWKELASDVGDFVESSYESAWRKLKNVPECAQVVPLGAEWAMKKGAYQVANVGLQIAQESLNAAKTLQAADPRILNLQRQIAQLQVQKKAVQAAQQAAHTGLEITKGLATATGSAGIALATIAQKGFDLKRVQLKARLDELSAGKTPAFGITAIIAGKKIDFDLQLNLKDSSTKIAKDIAWAIAKGAKGLIG